MTGRSARLGRSATFLTIPLTILLLHQLGSGPLSAPDSFSPDRLEVWITEQGAIAASFTLLRLAGLLVAYHLLAVTIVAWAGRHLRSRPLVRIAESLALPFWRSSLRRIAGIGLSTTVVLGSPFAALADPAPDPPVVEVPPVDGTATMQRLDREGHASMQLVDEETTTTAPAATPVPTDGPVSTTNPSTTAVPATEVPATTASTTAMSTSTSVPSNSAPTTAGPTAEATGPASRRSPSTPTSTPIRPTPRPDGSPQADGSETTADSGSSGSSDFPGSGRRSREVAATVEHTVVPGDHLWALAEARVTEAGGGPVGDVEIAHYWRRVVAANGQLDDPDLIFPGERVTLPPID